MSEPASNEPIAAAAHLGGKVIAGLPAQFLALVGMNAMFLGATLWFMSHHLDQRIDLLAKVLDACGATK